MLTDLRRKIINQKAVDGKNVKNNIMKILVSEEDLNYIEESISEN